MTRSRTALLLGLITLAGLVLRLFQFDQSLMGDEVSTLWVVSGNSFGEVLDLVSSDAEISPPLSFILSWLASKAGSDPNLIRLPSLIAGVATIPLVFLIGLRALGRNAGLVAAALFALSPFMTYFSGNGRGYSLMILFLAGSTLSMLVAAEDGRARWWAGYAVLSALAMYTHYTAIFILLAQFIWLLWAHPGRRRPAFLASVAAAVAFLPWLPNLLADLDSPTQPILEALQGDGFTAKRVAVEQWAFGHPLIEPSAVPGRAVMVVIVAGLLLAAVFTAIKLLKDEDGNPRISPGLVLVFVIALATPVGELVLALFGIDLFGSRNMTASWYGLVLAFAALIVIPGGVRTIVCAVLVIGGYGLAAASLLADDARVFDSKGPAALIDEEIRPGDVVIDINAALTSPTPQTPLEAYLEAQPSIYNPGLPEGEPPFLATAYIPPAGELSGQAFREAQGHRVFLLVPDVIEVEGGTGSPEAGREPVVDGLTLVLPENAEVTDVETFPGFRDSLVYTIEVGPAAVR